jgi:hypothetical protein
VKSETTKLYGSDPACLAALVDLAADDDIVWRGEELAGVLRHQLEAPIRVPMEPLAEPQELAAHAQASGLLLRSYGDLLFHPHPPLPLLRMVKAFAKRCRLGRHGALPREVATALYFAAVVAALLRCHRLITRLSRDGLLEGVNWALAQSWVNGPLRGLFEEGFAALAEKSFGDGTQDGSLAGGGCHAE